VGLVEVVSNSIERGSFMDIVMNLQVP